jgi:hypothetical protein
VIVVFCPLEQGKKKKTRIESSFLLRQRYKNQPFTAIDGLSRMDALDQIAKWMPMLWFPLNGLVVR